MTFVTIIVVSLEIGTPQETHYLEAENQTEMDEWIEALKQATVSPTSAFPLVQTNSCLIVFLQCKEIGGFLPCMRKMPKLF